MRPENLTGGLAALIGPVPERIEPDVLDRGGKEVLEEPGLSLGDLNPLIHGPDLLRRDLVGALTKVSRDKIEKYGGVMPVRLESVLVTSSLYPTALPQMRFVARFEVEHLTEEQILLLEKLVTDTYPVKVRTRNGTDGKKLPLENYPAMNPGEMSETKTSGWYMGPNQTPTDSIHAGLFLFRDLGQVSRKSFLEERLEGKYIVEVREAGMYQTDLVAFTTQVASVLGREKLVDSGELLYEIYYDLLRLGLKNVDNRSIYGMEEVITQIKKRLLFPLANPKLSRGIGIQPESVLLVGIPGTGKTLAVGQLLCEDTGVLVVPIDPATLVGEMSKEGEKRTLLPRLHSVAAQTGRKVVLHVDDVEKMVVYEGTYSTLLNLMAGVQESGFYMIASTNEPEEIPEALLQPQRFGVRIYCGPQQEGARYEILRMHANTASSELGIPIFDSEDQRRAVLMAIAEHTEYFPPRYLAAIVNAAKAHLLYRVAMQKGQHVGLTEADLRGLTLSMEDFRHGYEYVSTICDVGAMRARDAELKRFVQGAQPGRIGFSVTRETPVDFLDNL